MIPILGPVQTQTVMACTVDLRQLRLLVLSQYLQFSDQFCDAPYLSSDEAEAEEKEEEEEEEEEEETEKRNKTEDPQQQTRYRSSFNDQQL